MKKIALTLAIAALFSIGISLQCTTPQTDTKKDDKQKEPKITDTFMEIYNAKGRVIARGEIKKVEGKAVRHGAWTVFYDSGAKGKEGSYKDDKEDGLWTQYYESGKVGMKTTYQEGKKNGPAETYYDSGAKKSDENYALDKLDGKKTTYFQDGKVESEANYSMGKKIQIHKTYFPDGKLKSETGYLNDVKNGVSKIFYKDGTTISTFATYDNGSLRGPWYSSYPNGNRKMQGQYVPAPKSEEADTKGMEEKKVEGWKTGFWTFFHDNGKKAMEGAFTDNAQGGGWKMYSPEGWLSSDGPFVKGNQTGLWNYYTKTGGLDKKLTLSGSMPNGRGWLYENGKVIFEGDFTGLPQNLKKNGPGKELYPNGAIKSEGTYMMNMKNGPFKEYHPNGKLMAEGNYMTDKRTDQWVFYKEDGVTKDTEKSGTYMMGEKSKVFSAPGEFKFNPSFK